MLIVFVALTLTRSTSHLYLFSPSSASAVVNLRNALSTEFALARSSDKSSAGSYVLLWRLHDWHRTWLRSCSPKIRPTTERECSSVRKVRLERDAEEERAFWSFCICSARRRANSWASSCRPGRNALESCLSDLTIGVGVMTDCGCSSDLRMCSPTRWRALRPEVGRAERWAPERANWARGGVCARHCSTELRKQVLPRLRNPAPGRRALSHCSGQDKLSGSLSALMVA